MHFSWCSRPQHGHKPVKLHISGYQGYEIGEEHVDRVAKVVEGSHQHEHRPQAKDCDEGAVVPLLELEYAERVSTIDTNMIRSSHQKPSEVSTVFLRIFFARGS